MKHYHLGQDSTFALKMGAITKHPQNLLELNIWFVDMFHDQRLVTAAWSNPFSELVTYLVALSEKLFAA